MQVRNLEKLIIEREKICTKIRALRVQSIRSTRLQLLENGNEVKIDILIEEMETMLSKVFYDKKHLDELLDEIEDLL